MDGIGEMSAEERHRPIAEVARRLVSEALTPILRRLHALEARMKGQPARGLIYKSVREGANDKSAWMPVEASER
jgi:hypothetical protein